MASKRVCTACQRFGRSINPQRPIQQPFTAQRTFATTSSNLGRAGKYYLDNPPPRATPRPSPKPDIEDAKITVESKDPPPEANTTHMMAQELRRRATRTTETYIAYGATEMLVKECARVGNYSIPQTQEKGVETPKTKDGEDLGVGEGWWYTELGLTPTFSTWAQITFLHMYLLIARLRCFPADHAPTWHQHLLDHFFYEAEDRMTVVHQIYARGVRSRYLKDLFIQWRGLMAGYDEGLMKGDAVLATAVWRNIFKADEEVDLRKLAEVVSYMRRVLRTFDSVTDEVIATGRIKFGDPSSETALVSVESKMMAVPFTDEDGQPAAGTKKAD